MLIKTGEILLENGIINEEQLSMVKKLSKDSGISFDEALEQLNIVSAEDIAKCIAKHFYIEFLDIDNVTIDKEILDLVSEEIAKKHGVIPVEKKGRVLKVAMEKPPDIVAMDNLRFILGSDVECVLVTPESFRRAINLYNSNKGISSTLSSIDNLLDDFGGSGDKFDDIEIVDEEFSQSGVSEDDAPIIRVVMHVIKEAVKLGASDIHLEPMVDKLRIRYRIDGVCNEVKPLPKQVQGAVMSRIKIMAHIDITEKRKPQDGRISLKVADSPLDLRVSTIPVTNGESIVMRLLEKESIMIKLDKMGFSENDYERFMSSIKRPNGILLVTGPTGSGKTTTLYAALNELNKPDCKIITVENPIEYDLKGVNQCEVNELAGLTFPVILRSILRQDPNIVIVGEIRDVETAEIAIAAALTGHLILSTLHTNDAPSAITRLADMGTKPYLIASSLLGVLAQRLVRVICPNCKEPFKYSQKQLLEVGLNPDNLDNVVFYKGKGCNDCKGGGYKGRVGIYELMIVNNEIRELIYKNESRENIKSAAAKNRMKTLKEDGLRKVFEGVTTIEEVLRVAG